MHGDWTGQGLRNIAIGSYALEATINNANDNTAVGHNSGGNITSGDESTFLGGESGDGVTTGEPADGSLLHNVTGSQRSYYTKKFFARSSEYFFEQPRLEALHSTAPRSSCIVTVVMMQRHDARQDPTRDPTVRSVPYVTPAGCRCWGGGGVPPAHWP